MGIESRTGAVLLGHEGQAHSSSSYYINTLLLNGHLFKILNINIRGKWHYSLVYIDTLNELFFIKIP